MVMPPGDCAAGGGARAEGREGGGRPDASAHRRRERGDRERPRAASTSPRRRASCACADRARRGVHVRAAARRASRALAGTRRSSTRVSTAGWSAAPARASGSHAKQNTMSDPRKYGVVLQLAVRNSSRFSPSPAAAAGRVRSPTVVSRPIAISARATPTPAARGKGSANHRRRKPPGVPEANACSCVPM